MCFKNQLMRRWLAAPQPDEGGTLSKARGPMGLDELTSYKWLGIGNGQIRT